VGDAKRVRHTPGRRGAHPNRATPCGDPRCCSPLLFHALEVDCGDQETYLFTYLRELEATYIFVRTTRPRAPGTAVHMRFQHGDAAIPLTLDGQVIWVNPYRPADARQLNNPGMGIRFLDLEGDQRLHLMGLVKRLAFLDGAAAAL